MFTTSRDDSFPPGVLSSFDNAAPMETRTPTERSQELCLGAAYGASLIPVRLLECAPERDCIAMVTDDLIHIGACALYQVKTAGAAASFRADTRIQDEPCGPA